MADIARRLDDDEIAAALDRIAGSHVPAAEAVAALEALIAEAGWKIDDWWGCWWMLDLSPGSTDLGDIVWSDRSDYRAALTEMVAAAIERTDDGLRWRELGAA